MTGPADTEKAPTRSRSSLPSSRREWIKRGLAVLVSGIALYVVLPSLARVASAWPRLGELNPLWLGAAVLSEAVSFACTFGLQRLVLRTKSWFPVVTAGLTGNTVTDVLPGGDAAGAGVQFKMLSEAGIEAGQAGAGMSASSLLGIGGLFALPVFALPAIVGGSDVSPGLVHTALLGLVVFVLFVIGGILVLATDRPLAMVGRAAQWIWNRRPGKHHPSRGFDSQLLRERNAIRSVLGHHWVQAVLLVGGKLGFDFGSLLCALRATGARPSPSLVLLAYAATSVIALLPLTPGGLGIVEGSLSGLLVLARVHLSDALVATLAYRVASYWLPLLAGIVSYLLYRRRFDGVKRQARDEQPAG
jgi:uncharacterized protein (TIRG00374 family)